MVVQVDVNVRRDGDSASALRPAKSTVEHVPALDLHLQRSRPTASGFKIQEPTTSCRPARFTTTAPIGHRHCKLIPSSRQVFNLLTIPPTCISHNPCSVITTLVRGLLLHSVLVLRLIPTPVKYTLRTALMTMMTPMPHGIHVLSPQTLPFLSSRPPLLNAWALSSTA